eukprot:4890420-Prymnesium_polylepis.1
MLSSVVAHVSVLAFATGWVVGIAKLSQVLLTSDNGPFATHSEGRAEAYLLTFGLAKAVGNLIVGGAADTVGRRPCMVVGWAFGLVFSLAILLAPTWEAIIAADLLLGLNQAFCWSVALFIAVDWFGPTRRARAVGLVETLGYSAIALASPLVGAVGVDGIPTLHVTLLVMSLACALLSLLSLRETRDLALGEAGGAGAAGGGARDPAAARGAIVWPSGRRDEHSVVRLACANVSCLDGALMSCCLVGLALNFATAYAWGAMTRWLTHIANAEGGATTNVGVVLLAYSMPKGLLQLPAGALADRRPFGCGAREFVVVGLLVVAAALVGLAALAGAQLTAAATTAGALPLAMLLGAGTAVAYSPVIACVVARAEPSWRSAAVGTYRFWRDLGYAVGGLLLGKAVDGAHGIPWVAPALAALAMATAALLFAWVYPRERGAAARENARPVRTLAECGAELSEAEGCASSTRGEERSGARPQELLSRDATRSEA